MSQTLQIAVVGAQGLVGQALLELLAERNFPSARVFAVDAGDQAGNMVGFGNIDIEVHSLDDFDFANVGLAFFVAGGEIAREWAPQARGAGATVVDFSSAFRHADDVPLVFPPANAAALDGLEQGGLVSVPNCTVSPLAWALAPFAELGLERVTVATYQSVSGTGQAALEELATQTTALFGQREYETNVYAKRIAFNLLPQIGAVGEDGLSEEERSVVDELRKLFGQPELAVEASCVRVPMFFGHAWAVTISTQGELSVESARQRFLKAGLMLVDEPAEAGGYATPMEVAGSSTVCVSRVRRNANDSLSFWVTADNVRAGAALPCLMVAEWLIQRGHFQ
ncbi:aspartate-semialdehyde dehydrogenase [Crenobacter sp. SG2303]|uniref:Aspartate-semialdehyde dehydrogenase n=1 Tax=Crenobacter oryzisoli TaxID=3056844 RepID=A0ABT7XKH5_9NEIS|nr:aspartate-semialdehyde dehydrogenase [Crenobacter sp. SG2303]MDN0074283.1 aspartate-semialdehyde dehydrogenase [Crenobacter sp. SG2303]